MVIVTGPHLIIHLGVVRFRKTSAYRRPSFVGAFDVCLKRLRESQVAINVGKYGNRVFALNGRINYLFR